MRPQTLSENRISFIPKNDIQQYATMTETEIRQKVSEKMLKILKENLKSRVKKSK